MRFLIILWFLATVSALSAQDKGVCVFCEIAAGNTPQTNSIVYRDDLVVAFMDRAPRNPGPERGSTQLLLIDQLVQNSSAPLIA